MKLLCLVLVSVSIVSLEIAPGAIKNGYVEIENARKSLNSLKSITLSTTNLPPEQRRKVEGTIKSLTDYITYFELTEELLGQFRLTAVELYKEIDSIRDKNGKLTDVYIKFIPKAAADIQHPGSTYLIYRDGDDTSYSEYGPHTVSVKVWIMDTSLSILAHELGHIKFEVPNLADYNNYHKVSYRAINNESNYLGHRPSDPSGQSAFAYEKRFSENRKAYLRSTQQKQTSPFQMLTEIRERIKTEFSQIT